MPAPAATPQALHTAVVDVIIPVYNEELDLSASVLRLDHFLAETFPYDYRVINR
jgi:hypothetical protein